MCTKLVCFGKFLSEICSLLLKNDNKNVKDINENEMLIYLFRLFQKQLAMGIWLCLDCQTETEIVTLTKWQKCHLDSWRRWSSFELIICRMNESNFVLDSTPVNFTFRYKCIVISIVESRNHFSYWAEHVQMWIDCNYGGFIPLWWNFVCRHGMYKNYCRMCVCCRGC